MARIRRGETIWSKGWGDPYHANSARPPSCATGSEKKYDPCIHCLQELRARGGICEVLMREEGHWVILDASMVILTFLGHTAHNWSGLQLWLERVGYHGLYVFLLLGHFGRCCEVLWNEGLRTHGMVLLHWALSGLTTNVVQCWDIVCCLMADVSQTGEASGSLMTCRMRV